MKLKDLTKMLLTLESRPGHANMEVYTTDSRSGCTSKLYSARATNEVTDSGPFDLDEGEFYITITADH